MKWVALLSFGLIGICLLIVGMIYAIKTGLLYRSGLHAKGKVVEMIQSGSADAEAGYLVVEFQTENGQTIRFRGNPDDAGSAKLFVDATVEVLYSASNPHQARVTRIRELWQGSALMGLAGLVFFLFGFFGYRLIDQSDKVFASHEDDRRVFYRQMLYEGKQGVRIPGTVTEIQARKDGYVLVCRAKMPEGKSDQTFVSTLLRFDPGNGLRQQPVDIYVHPLDRDCYYVHLDPLLQKIVEAPNPSK
jgi:hypothetical protein